MKIKLFTLLLFYTGLITGTSANETKGPIGVLSLMGENANLVQVGFSIFENESAVNNVKEWNVDNEVEDELAEQFKKLGYSSVTLLGKYKNTIKQKYYDYEAQHQFELTKPLAEFLQRTGSSLGLKEILVLGKSSGPILTTNQYYLGYGYYVHARRTVGHFKSVYFILDVEKNMVTKSGFLDALMPVENNRQLTDDEKSAIFNYVKKDEINQTLVQKYRQQIYDGNFTKTERKLLEKTYSAQNSSMEYFEDMEHKLMVMLYPPIGTPSMFHILLPTDRSSLDKSLEKIQQFAVKQLPEKLAFIPVRFESEGD
ncbi:MAG: hypothetical protein OEZ39_04075 [Gammaproteobacteria bacterium]|nr:hypothetical protein [Gammaproteobacteria bacterium]MDH5651035.1 hypothetical protein [Gammaproteobacteria bacterium]